MYAGGQDSIEGIGHVPGKIEETSTVFTAAGQHGTVLITESIKHYLTTRTYRGAPTDMY